MADTGIISVAEVVECHDGGDVRKEVLQLAGKCPVCDGVL